jgi:hypothetical protein
VGFMEIAITVPQLLRPEHAWKNDICSLNKREFLLLFSFCAPLSFVLLSGAAEPGRDRQFAL